MASNRTRTVFVGNISFDATEEDLRALFGSVGVVNNLRLVIDRDTGKRKGFGFVEFTDQEMAHSAVRNLNELDFHGRTLRVNLAEQDTKNPEAAVLAKRKRTPDGGPVPPGAVGVGGAGRGGLPPPPVGGEAMRAPLPNLDPISAYVERLGRAQMFELALQAKHFAATQEAEAFHLFQSNPQLYSAMHLVIDRLAGPHWPPPPTEAPVSVGASLGVGAWAERVAGVGSGRNPTPPQQPPAQPPTQPAPPQPPVKSAEQQRAETAAAMGVDPQQLDQLLNLSPAQLAGLPAEQQAQVALLQQQLRQG